MFRELQVTKLPKSCEIWPKKKLLSEYYDFSPIIKAHMNFTWIFHIGLGIQIFVPPLPPYENSLFPILFFFSLPFSFFLFTSLFTSVSDPDPFGSVSFWSAGSGSASMKRIRIQILVVKNQPKSWKISTKINKNH